MCPDIQTTDASDVGCCSFPLWRRSSDNTVIRSVTCVHIG